MPFCLWLFLLAWSVLYTLPIELLQTLKRENPQGNLGFVDHSGSSFGGTCQCLPAQQICPKACPVNGLCQAAWFFGAAVCPPGKKVRRKWTAVLSWDWTLKASIGIVMKHITCTNGKQCLYLKQANKTQSRSGPCFFHEGHTHCIWHAACKS